MKKLSMLLFGVIIISSFNGCGLFKKDPKVRCAGSAIYLTKGKSDKEYYIDGLEGKFVNNYYFNEDYYYDPDGKEYMIRSGIGFAYDKVKLSPKHGNYNSTVLDIDLATYDLSKGGITIWGKTNYVNVYSSDPNRTYDVCFIVDYNRKKPCDFKFTNVKIKTAVNCSVINNFSACDMNVCFEGDNYFEAGEPFSIDDILAGKISDEIQRYYSFTYYIEYYNRCKNYIVSYLEGASVTDVLIDAWADFTDVTLDVMEDLWKGTTNFLTGSNGDRGIDGSPTIMSFGSINFYGNGNANIIGGDGGEGGSGGFSLSGSSNGGKGGNSASGVMCVNLFDDVDGILEIKAGTPGKGGRRGGSLLGHSSSGYSGGKAEDYVCEFYCKAPAI